MPLHPDTIKHEGFVAGANANSYRSVGYDLTVGSIYVPKDGWLPKAKQRLLRNKLVDEYEIPPQGVAVIFSAETVDMPTGYCGYAMPKTSLCSDGILVLNTGIIDPGYRGLLSGTTINFSDMPYKLKKGDPFLRLVFDPIAAPATKSSGRTTTPLSDTERNKYCADKVSKAINFPATFLNIPETVRIVSKDVLAEERNFLLYALAVFAAFLTVISIVPAFIPKDYLPNTPTKDQIELLAKEYADRRTIQSSIDTMLKRIDTMEEGVKKSQSAVESLERRIQQPPPSPQPPAPQSPLPTPPSTTTPPPARNR